MIHTEESCLPTKKRVTDALWTQIKDLICLSDNKQRDLVDFVSRFPEIATKAATQTNIIHGFVESGLIDSKSQRYPVMHKILSACRKMILQNMPTKIVDRFKLLYNLTVEQGWIGEEVFDYLGFPCGMDANGKEALRNTGISQESHQQSNFLTMRINVTFTCNELLRLKQNSERKYRLGYSKMNGNTL